MPFPGMGNSSKMDPYAPLNAKQLNSLYSTGKWAMPSMSSGIMAGGFPGMMGMPKAEQVPILFVFSFRTIIIILPSFLFPRLALDKEMISHANQYLA
jgi:hypothetical protein